MRMRKSDGAWAANCGVAKRSQGKVPTGSSCRVGLRRSGAAEESLHRPTDFGPGIGWRPSFRPNLGSDRKTLERQDNAHIPNHRPGDSSRPSGRIYRSDPRLFSAFRLSSRGRSGTIASDPHLEYRQRHEGCGYSLARRRVFARCIRLGRRSSYKISVCCSGQLHRPPERPVCPERDHPAFYHDTPDRSRSGTILRLPTRRSQTRPAPSTDMARGICPRNRCSRGTGALCHATRYAASRHISWGNAGQALTSGRDSLSLGRQSSVRFCCKKQSGASRRPGRGQPR